MEEKLSLETVLNELYKLPDYQKFDDENKKHIVQVATSSYEILSKHFDKILNVKNLSTALIELFEHYCNKDLDKLIILAKSKPDSEFGSFSDELIRELVKNSFLLAIEIFKTMGSSDDLFENEKDKAEANRRLIETFNLQGETLRLFNENKLSIGDYLRLNVRALFPVSLSC